MKSTLFQKKTILRIVMNRINRAFSLMETIISISAISFLILLIIGITFFLYSGFNKARNNSEKLNKTAKLLYIVTENILNTDLFPAHNKDEYLFEEREITFFSNGKKVNYSFNKVFKIKTESAFDLSDDVSGDKQEIKKESSFNSVKDFYIKYYDKDNLPVFNDEIPFYCEFYFIFEDKTEKMLKMRL